MIPKQESLQKADPAEENSNPRPFDQGHNALTTELPPLPLSERIQIFVDRKCHAKFVNDRGGGGGGAVDLSAPCRQHRETGCSGFIGYAKERVVCLQSDEGGSR